MHYYIDGYNLLFRLMDTSKNLQSLREQLIEDINKKVSFLKLDVTLVFDAHFQFGGGTRTHFDALEILFTSHGESADEFLIDEIMNSLHPHRETVVTSDKKLTWRVRHKSAHTQSVEIFIESLNRMYRNKQKELATPQPAARKMNPLLANLTTPTPKQLPENKSLEGSLGYYEQLFEMTHQKLMEEEKQKPIKETSKRQPKQKMRPAWPEAIEKMDGEGAMERWEKIFQRNFEENNR